MSSDQNKELREIMQTQMGMDPDTCDPATIELFKNKFFGAEAKKPKKKKSKVREIGEDEEAMLRNHKEGDIHLETRTKSKKSKVADSKVVGNANLDFADILNEIELKKDKGAADGTLNTTKLKKQLKNLKRDPSNVLSEPLPGYKRVKIMRDQANQLNTKIVAKYLPQVKVNREEEQHDFTTGDKLRSGGNVNLKSLGQIASNLTEATASSQMEKRITE